MSAAACNQIEAWTGACLACLACVKHKNLISQTAAACPGGHNEDAMLQVMSQTYTTRKKICLRVLLNADTIWFSMLHHYARSAFRSRTWLHALADSSWIQAPPIACTQHLQVMQCASLMSKAQTTFVESMCRAQLGLVHQKAARYILDYTDHLCAGAQRQQLDEAVFAEGARKATQLSEVSS